MILEGVGTALFTPFKKDGSVDYETFAANVDRQIEAGVHFLVPLGTTGETPTLSTEERIEILKIAKAHSAGRPVVVGGGTNSVPDTLAAMASLEPYGPDVFLIVVPYYNKPPQEGMYQYFKTVAAATKKPVLIYNVPGRTGANITAETTLRLAKDVPNIIGIKEASSKREQILQIIEGAPDGFSVLSGNDDETADLMKAGARGVISVASNVAPAEMAALTNALLAGDLEYADTLDAQLRDLYRDLFIESNPIPGKAAMAQLGLMENVLRLPLVPASPATEEAMAKTIKALWQK
ncbi:MAG: 4-hydroxy-tetrahydrodipicolinate synthase [Bacteroidales bacterium]|nr:4-hydroxy-tetrahydrodipicolinate synthase [Bacteroidales bacterium]